MLGMRRPRKEQAGMEQHGTWKSQEKEKLVWINMGHETTTQPRKEQAGMEQHRTCNSQAKKKLVWINMGHGTTR
eukprot:1159000-Pelagomonas_calceolata.AAC.5